MKIGNFRRPDFVHGNNNNEKNDWKLTVVVAAQNEFE